MPWGGGRAVAPSNTPRSMRKIDFSTWGEEEEEEEVVAEGEEEEVVAEGERTSSQSMPGFCSSNKRTKSWQNICWSSASL